VKNRPRNLLIVLGDQLAFDTEALKALDQGGDAVWMAECGAEYAAAHTHTSKTVFFLSAMRHFRDGLLSKGFSVHYRPLDQLRDEHGEDGLGAALERDLEHIRPQAVWAIRPGSHHALEEITRAARRATCSLRVWEDDQFLITPDQFRQIVSGKRPVMESFYRTMRTRFGMLMSSDGAPEAGRWNFDRDNRGHFRDGPGAIKQPRSFHPDNITRHCIRLVQKYNAAAPGSLDTFDLPVTHSQARALLRDFIDNRLQEFGTFQDAMWTNRPFLYHSRLSCALNAKLLSPSETIEAIERAYHDHRCPIHSAEGFIRQILGWREYVRGIYWREMPGYAFANALDAHESLPAFFWSGETRMHCVRQVMHSILTYSYAHHIQRLMVMGLFCLLWGADPRAFHQWHLAMYADALDWVSLPNALGMSQFADGGLMATKPYAASGKYIDRMSNYCDVCPYEPARADGENACPFTTLYWSFLHRHYQTLRHIGRMSFQLKNVRGKSSRDLRDIEARAAWLRRTATDV
jgi:deoxyribodipyrimidine photolyase-related protein